MEIKTVEKMTTGERIRYYRKQKKITPENTLINTGLNKKQLYKLETNRRKISYDEIKQISKNLGIKTTDLIAPTIVNTSIEEMTVGEKIKYYRKRRKYSLSKLSELSNIPSNIIGEYERNCVKKINYDYINNIATALEIKINDLIDDLPIKKSIEEMTIGEKIEYYRKQQGLTKTKLAELIGVRVSLITRYENNRRKPPLEKIQALSVALKIPLNYLCNLYLAETPYHSSTELLYIDASLPARILYYKEQQNISTYELSDKTGINYNTLIYYLKNVINPNLESINKIAKVLNVDAMQLIDLSVYYNNKKDINDRLKSSIIKNMSFDERVIYYRRLQGMSQKEFVENLERKQSTIANYEHSKPHIPLLKNINLIAQILNVSVTDLVELYVAERPYTPPIETYEIDAVTGDRIVKYIKQPYLLPNMTVGERIRFYRKQQQLTQKDLGKRMNCNFSTISNYERDVQETHYIESINKIAKALNVDACQLFEFYVVDKK